MQELERLLREHGIRFDRNGNRIRCFPHVINIAVKAAIKLLSKTPACVLTAAENYAEALANDPISRARKLVQMLRVSWPRRQGLRDAIKDGNMRKLFKYEKQILHSELLRDVDTRWSSLLLMIDRFIEMYEGIMLFLDKAEQKHLKPYALTEMELRVLIDIRQFLYIFHAVQEILSYEKTPTLSMTIPTYEQLLVLLRTYRTSDLKTLAHAVNVAILRIEKYLAYARTTRIYALAMGESGLFLLGVAAT
ncbi:hypothetical protein BXZ70DRAFT_1002994 [Cristinia sonorae]|uniref:Uncharacterized protein n=1 Tax=Cristinia sonorae TaxID=1940300 RepID=A0A8K0XK51_9AGAR|nr:hypothetical protein BXZ70DRAFT_1002994 [Cristinia sonorae]